MRDRIRAFFRRNTPPGLPLKGELTYCLVLQGFAFLFVLCSFFLHYDEGLAELFSYPSRKLIEGAVIAPFTELIDPYLIRLYLPMTLAMLFPILYHYTYYRRESMSIYLMKRLPNRWERHRRALTVPILMALATAASALLLRVVCFAIYLIGTPRVCLPADTLAQLWRFSHAYY